ncbi:MAG: STAS domain-containing protein [Bacteroidetes bacterium]|nr:MAG: STAS domain-containing protein [Bacteroidota bacterium]
MNNSSKKTISNIPLQVSKGCVIASIQVDLTEEVSKAFRVELLEYIRENGATGVILDVSGVDIMDLDDFISLKNTLSMVEVMGAKPVLAGLKPGVVVSLIELGAETQDIHAAFNLDEAFLLLDELRAE